jgi:hypothetical protein
MFDKDAGGNARFGLGSNSRDMSQNIVMPASCQALSLGAKRDQAQFAQPTYFSLNGR